MKRLLGKVTVPCSYCGKLIQKHRYRVTAGNVYCNMTCRSAKRSEVSTYHGADPRYGLHWAEQQARARTRANERCEACGVRQEALSEALHVHHITPFRAFKLPDGSVDYVTAHDLDNLAVLCRPCHQKADMGSLPGFYRPSFRGYTATRRKHFVGDGVVEVACEVCGAVFKAQKWRVEHGYKKTCSKKCRYILTSIKQKGKKRS